MSLFNPWLWLAFILMLAGAGFTGYRQGVKATKADYEEAARVAMTAMIDRHNELAEQDRKAAVDAEKRRQQKRIKDMEAQHALELEAERNHRPECDWSDGERGLLNDIIDRANGREATPGGVPDGVRQPAATVGEHGSGGQGLGWAGRLKFWRVPEPAR